MNMRRVTGPSECPPETRSCAGSLDAGSPTGFRSGAFGGPGRQDADDGDLPSPEQYDFPRRSRARITSVFRIPSARHLRLGLNLEILNVARATPAISLNRPTQICGPPGRAIPEVIPARALNERSCTPFVDTGVGRDASRRGPWEASSNREEFVSNEANSDSVRNLGVEEEGSHGLKDILSQFVPRISLSHDRLGQTLGNVAFVPVLRDLEYDLSVHVLSISPRSTPC